MNTELPASFQYALLILGVIVIGSNSFVLSPILSDVAATMQTDPVTIARVISAYGLATAISAFFLGGIVDRYGARLALVGSAAAMALALAASAASPSWPVLATAQAVAGLAGGVMLPAIYTTATALAAPGQGARMLSRVLSGWALSLVAGVPVSAFLTDLASWRLAYSVLCLIAAGATVGFLFLPRIRPVRSATQRVTPLRALRVPGVIRLLLICVCFMTAFYGTFALIGDYLRTTLGLNAAEVSSVSLAYGLGFGLAGVAGGLVDRLGPIRVYPFVLAAVALVYLLMPLSMHTLASAVAGAFVWGAVNHFGLNILVLSLSQRDPSARGAIMGLNSTATYLAVFAGPLLMGFLYTTHGFVAVTEMASGLVAVSAVIALVAALASGRERRNAGQSVRPNV